MGLIQKDAFRTMLVSYIGIVLGYLNKGFLFLIILSTEQIGLVNLLYSVGMLFAQFANLGTIYTTWKFLPFFKNEEKKHHGFMPLMLLIVSAGILLCTAVAIIFRTEIQAIYIEKSPEFVAYYFWMIPIGISTVLYLIFEVYLRSFYKNIVSVIANDIVLRLGLTLILFIYWFRIVNFSQFVILHSLIYSIPALVLIVYLYRMKELNWNIKTIQIKQRFKRIILQFSAYFYINTLGIVLVNTLDVLMIAQLLGLRATGIYSTIIFLASALQVPYKSIIRVSSPLVSDYWKHRQFDEMRELYTKVSSVSLVLGLGMFLFIWMNISFFFSFLKPEFSAGIGVFFYLMLGRIFDMFFGLNGSIFTMSKKYKYDIYFTLFLILSVYFLNLWFIPLWGMVGAAISTSVAMVFVNSIRVLFVWQVFKMHPFHKNQFIIIGLGVLTLYVGALTQGLVNNKWIQFSIESILFMGCFVTPILVFNLEPETISYFKKGSRFIKEKLKR